MQTPPNPLPTRRELRAAEERERKQQYRASAPNPHLAPTVRTKKTLPRQRVLSGVAMAFVALLAVSVSLPALSVTPQASGALAQDTASTEEPQSLLIHAAESITIQRDGYTIEVPAQAAYSEAAGMGTWASLDLGQLSGQGWALPVSGTITSPFGSRPNKPVDGVGDYHNGTDIAAGCGLPVYAATGGIVIEAGYQGTYGNWVLIDHGNGVQTGYAHNSSILVSEGEQIAAGATIALVGSTGASTGCHLHFETRIDGTQVDPEPFMSAREITLG